MPYNPAIHHRRSIRLPEFDYTQPGAYYVTIVIHERACLLGELPAGALQLNGAGRMVEKWWHEINRKFS